MAYPPQHAAHSQAQAQVSAQIQQRLLIEQQQRNIAHQQQHAQHQQHQQQMAAQAQAQAGHAQQGGVMEAMPDGNDGLRAAKRRKPTDRSLPSFAQPSSSAQRSPTELKLGPSTDALESLSASYGRLQAVERKLDWNVSRRRVDLGEQLGVGRLAPTKRTLRVHLSAKVLDQPWQQDLANLPEPAAAGGEGEEAASAAEDLEKGEGVPRFEFGIGGSLVGAAESDPRLFTSFVKRVVVETDRDPAQFDLVGPVDWHRPQGSHLNGQAGLSLTFPTTVPTELKLSLYLDHKPERFSLVPQLAEMLDLAESDRVGVLQALWAYVKANALLAEDRKTVKCDAKMKSLFSDQDRIPFHHLPEYVNRFIGPPAPVVITHTVKVDKDAGPEQTASFDIEIGQDDGSRAELEKVHERLIPTGDAVRAIVALDEKIALDACSTRSALLKRSFLSSFASSPAEFIDDFLRSQSSDLSLLLSSAGDRSAQRAVGGGPDWRESSRWVNFWQGSWVEEAGAVWSRREVEGKIRKAVGSSQGQPAAARGYQGASR